MKDQITKHRDKLGVKDLQAYIEAGVFGEPEGPETLEVKEVFSDGLYMRVLVIPRGKIVVGKLHKGDCMNILLKGTLMVAGDNPMQITAPYWFVSPPWTKKAVVALSDVLFANVHPNPDNGQDMVAIEERLIEPEPKPTLGRKGVEVLESFQGNVDAWPSIETKSP